MVWFNQDKYNKNNLDRNKVFAACAKCMAETIQHIQQHPLLEKISKLKKGGKHIEQQYMQILNKYIDFPAFDNQQVDGAACYKYRPDRLYLDGNKQVYIHIECDKNEHWRLLHKTVLKITTTMFTI